MDTFQRKNRRFAKWTRCGEDRVFSYGFNQLTGSSKKIPAKFGDTCSVRADGLCIGCLGQWAERGREHSNMQEFFRTTL